MRLTRIQCEWCVYGSVSHFNASREDHESAKTKTKNICGSDFIHVAIWAWVHLRTRWVFCGNLSTLSESMDDYRKSKFTEQLFVILFGRSSLRATPSCIRKSMQWKEEKMEFFRVINYQVYWWIWWFYIVYSLRNRNKSSRVYTIIVCLMKHRHKEHSKESGI